jgi:Tfp pilus assembly protein PilP
MERNAIMPKAPPSRLNKEKFLGLLALVALAAAVAYHLETRPLELSRADPLTRTPPPPAYKATRPLSEVAEVGTPRLSPFRPVTTPLAPVVVAGNNGPKIGGRGVRDEPPKVVKIEVPRDPTVNLEYAGLASGCGQTHGLLRDAKGSYRRVQVGDVLSDVDCTVVEIGDQSITLRARGGRVYELKNSRVLKVSEAARLPSPVWPQ